MTVFPRSNGLERLGLKVNFLIVNRVLQEIFLRFNLVLVLIVMKLVIQVLSERVCLGLCWKVSHGCGWRELCFDRANFQAGWLVLFLFTVGRTVFAWQWLNRLHLHVHVSVWPCLLSLLPFVILLNDFVNLVRISNIASIMHFLLPFPENVRWDHIQQRSHSSDLCFTFVWPVPFAHYFAVDFDIC